LIFSAVNLVKIRAEAMHYASEIEPGGMANIYIRPDSKLNYALKMARDWCLDKGIEKPVCSISNYLNPDCKVVAGHLEVRSIQIGYWKKILSIKNNPFFNFYTS